MKNNYQSVINNMNEASDVVFVVGSPRSGTGVIARSIGASHDLCYLGETGIFCSVLFAKAPLGKLLSLVSGSGWLWSNFRMFSALMKMRIGSRLRSIDRLKEFVDEVLLYTKIDNDLIPLRPSNPIHTVVDVKLDSDDKELASKLLDKYEKLIKKDLSKFVAVVLEDLRMLSGRSRILEKTPGHVHLLPLIWDVFPKAKVVFTKRSDKRSILSSYYLMTKSKKKVRIASKGFDRLEGIRRKESKEHKDLIQTLDYDDLLADPLFHLREIYAWLGITEPERLQSDICEIQQKPSKYGQLDAELKAFVDSFCGDS